MKLSDELIDELIKEIIGSDALTLVRYVKNKTDVSEFKIAEVLGVNINTVRNILYRLSSHNLVSSIRKKDKKKGWYIYYWTFNPFQAAELLLKLKQKKLDGLRNHLHRMVNETFFVCPNDGLTLTYESALEHDFKCPEDGELLKQKDPALEIERLKRDIEKLEIDVSSGFEVELPKVKKTRKSKKEVISKKKIRKLIRKRAKIAKIKTKLAKKKIKIEKKQKNVAKKKKK